MTQTNKPIGREAQNVFLSDDELNAICGGSVKTQALSSAVSDVMKNIGQALQTAARG